MASDEEKEARERLVEGLWGDPESRRALEKMIVKKWPKTAGQLPHLAAEEAGEKILQRVSEKEAAFDGKVAKFEGDRQREAFHRRIKDGPHKIRDEEIADVEKIMTEEYVANYDTAAEILRARQQVAAPSGVAFSTHAQIPGVGGAGGDDYKGIVENRDQWARDMAHRVAREFQHS